jgi:hypothetical protein
MNAHSADVLFRVIESAPYPTLLLEERIVRGFNEKADELFGKVWKGYDLNATLPEQFADMLCSGCGNGTVDYDVNGIRYCFLSNTVDKYRLIYALLGSESASVPAGQLHVTGIRFGELMQTQLSLIQRMKRDEEQISPLLDKTYRNALRMLRQTRHMTEYAQYISGQKKLMEQDADIAEVIENTVTRLRKEYGTYTVNFQNEIRRNTMIRLDLEKFEMLFLNLMSNAFKFTVKDPITVLLSSANETVSVTVTNHSGEVPIPGIHPRALTGLRNDNEAAGYGLALVSQITKLHKGWLQIGQQNGLFRVTVILPWRKGSGQTVSQPESVFDDSGGFSKLLVEMSDVPE